MCVRLCVCGVSVECVCFCVCGVCVVCVFGMCVCDVLCERVLCVWCVVLVCAMYVCEVVCGMYVFDCVRGSCFFLL